MREINVLSVKNPYGYMICRGIKDVENRTWRTNYRGELYIHACGLTEWDYPDYALPKEILIEYQNFWDANDKGETYNVSPLTQKCFDLDIIMDQYRDQKKQPYFQSDFVIGKVDLIDCIDNSQSIFAQKNCWHWILANPVLIENPIPAKGKLKIWKLKI